jgi:hypothetical protein
VRRHHTGSGRRAVIPTDWAAHHTGVAEGFMDKATINLHGPGSAPAWNETTKRTESPPGAAIAAGVPARIQALTEISVPANDVADEQIRIIGYRISVPAATSPAALVPGVLVDVVTCAGDPLLAGRSMTVTDVVRGTHRFERDLVCDLND